MRKHRLFGWTSHPSPTLPAKKDCGDASAKSSAISLQLIVESRLFQASSAVAVDLQTASGPPATPSPPANNWGRADQHPHPPHSRICWQCGRASQLGLGLRRAGLISLRERSVSEGVPVTRVSRAVAPPRPLYPPIRRQVLQDAKMRPRLVTCSRPWRTRTSANRSTK